MRGALILAVLLLALPAGAAEINWNRNGGSQNTTGLSPGEFATMTPAANSDSSKILSVGACENLDVFHFDDADGDTTVSTTTWEVELCPDEDAAFSTEAIKDAACEIAAGTAALSGDDVESNLAAQYLRILGDSAGANPEEGLILVKCALRGN